MEVVSSYSLCHGEYSNAFPSVIHEAKSAPGSTNCRAAFVSFSFAFVPRYNFDENRCLRRFPLSLCRFLYLFSSLPLFRARH